MNHPWEGGGKWNKGLDWDGSGPWCDADTSREFCLDLEHYTSQDPHPTLIGVSEWWGGCDAADILHSRSILISHAI